MINPLVAVMLWSTVILGISIWGMAGWGEEESDAAAGPSPGTGSIKKVPPPQPGPARKTGTAGL